MAAKERKERKKLIRKKESRGTFPLTAEGQSSKGRRGFEKFGLREVVRFEAKEAETRRRGFQGSWVS
jgi:hypothetical protein